LATSRDPANTSFQASLTIPLFWDFDRFNKADFKLNIVLFIINLKDLITGIDLNSS